VTTGRQGGSSATARSPNVAPKRAAVIALARAAAVLLAGFVVVVEACPGVAAAEYRDPPRRDEFGLVPEEPRDEDLKLPDPVLDRTWAGPKPGEEAAAKAAGEPEGEADPEAPEAPDADPPEASDPGKPPDRARPRAPDAGPHDLDRPASEPDFDSLRPEPRRQSGDPLEDEAGDDGDLGDSGPAGE
jgi:hypothetical protein